MLKFQITFKLDLKIRFKNEPVLRKRCNFSATALKLHHFRRTGSFLKRIFKSSLKVIWKFSEAFSSCVILN